MKGLELSKKFYKEYGEPMLKENFAHLLPFIAVGLFGSGSECYGYDDDISADHDFEPGFCIMLPDEDIVDRKNAFQLERAYAKLPKEFLGFKRSLLSAVGGNRHGVIRMGDFFKDKTGSENGVLTVGGWLSLPEFSLLEAVNGEIFCDNYGLFSKIRHSLKYYPEDIRLKKLAGNLLLMGQAGQYNYKRCIARNDTAAAQLAVFEFVKSAVAVLFLLDKKYMPYYKWCFKALKEISTEASRIADLLEFLISSGNGEDLSNKKCEIIESVCNSVADMLIDQNLLHNKTAEMERAAYLVNDTIKDNGIRNMHILSGV